VQGDFRALAKLPALIPVGVAGNPDYLSLEDLQARAWPLVEAATDREEASAGAAFERARNRGKGLDLLDDVVAAAAEGRVRRLWLEAQKRVPGTIDAATGRIVAAGSADEDILEALASTVLARSGEVIVAEPSRMPVTTGVAAELR
jgi:hypothetical protein